MSLTFDATLRCDKCGREEPCKVAVVLDNRKIPELKIEGHYSWDLEAKSYHDENEHHCPDCAKTMRGF